MEINGTGTGASTYAMKKAMELPNLMLSLVEQTAAGSGKQRVSGTEPAAGALAADRAAVTGKGLMIDSVA